ncbi:MAG: class I SAM-dependent methyltransferase [Candidatus Omnitrophica bacterium]|nr:class I SAM-dependent methyltransferase [Candidatus Omnitrophota bacterium]
MLKELINSNLKKMGYKVVRLKAYLSDFDDFPFPVRENEQRFDYEKAIQFLIALNVGQEAAIRLGSIPEKSLRYLESTFREYLGSEKPLMGLHVGNFVGISLVWAADRFKRIHRDSVMVSIDPNMSHRGISYPAKAVEKLANYFGLQKNIMFLLGYSVERASCEASCQGVSFENTLANLIVLTEGKYDVAFIDGNHEAAYVSRELDSIFRLLKPSGLVIMDDVDEYWQAKTGLKDIYDKADEGKFDKEGTDGRIGVLRKK